MQGVSRSYHPRIYLRNPEWDPSQASDNVEAALSSFRTRMIAAAAAHRKYSRPNLLCIQNSALRKIVDHNKYIFIWADKNMGVVIMLHCEYIKQCLKEHLGNPRVYKNITLCLQQEIAKLNRKYVNFMDRNDRILGHQVLTFFKRGMELYGDSIARFGATAKVHKLPEMLRPVVAKVGTAIESVSSAASRAHAVSSVVCEG